MEGREGRTGGEEGEEGEEGEVMGNSALVVGGYAPVGCTFI